MKIIYGVTGTGKSEYVFNEIQKSSADKIYNSNYYELSDEYSVSTGSKIKEKLWTHPSWRFFIRILQKTGIMKFLKKIKNGNREE